MKSFILGIISITSIIILSLVISLDYNKVKRDYNIKFRNMIRDVNDANRSNYDIIKNHENKFKVLQRNVSNIEDSINDISLLKKDLESLKKSVMYKR